MKSAILDTSFILSCVRNKIDFAEKIAHEGFEIIIPEQVLKELRSISSSQKKQQFRNEANLSLEILKKVPFKKIELEANYVDEGIKIFAIKNPDAVVATLP